MRRVIFAFALLSLLIAVAGSMPTMTVGLASPTVEAAEAAPAFELTAVEAVAVGKSCQWGCTAGQGGGGQADTTSASRCAATCAAACGGEDNCAWFSYRASAVGNN